MEQINQLRSTTVKSAKIQGVIHGWGNGEKKHKCSHSFWVWAVILSWSCVVNHKKNTSRNPATESVLVRMLHQPITNPTLWPATSEYGSLSHLQFVLFFSFILFLNDILPKYDQTHTETKMIILELSAPSGVFWYYGLCLLLLVQTDRKQTWYTWPLQVWTNVFVFWGTGVLELLHCTLGD